MAKIEYQGTEYKSRAELARVLLLKNEMRKSEIAKITGIAPQTVHGQYQRLVKAGKMEDVYSALVEKLDKKDESIRTKKKEKIQKEKELKKQARIALRAKKKEDAKKEKEASVAEKVLDNKI